MGAHAARIRRPPTRSCVACRTAREKRALLRVVRTPGGDVQLDRSGRLNGRGAYVDPDPSCIDTAIDRGLLARALETSLPADLRPALLAEVGQPTIAGGTSGQE